MGLGGGGSCWLYFGSDATFQDDVVAITALSCKRETLGIFQEERHGALASGSHGRHEYWQTPPK